MRPPERIIINPIRIYDLKFFLKSAKKFGPAIKPTDETKRIRPKFSTILSAFPLISTAEPSASFCVIVVLNVLEKNAPYKSAITNTPAVPSDIPLIVIRPSEYPSTAMKNTDNIKNAIPVTEITPPNKVTIRASFI